MTETFAALLFAHALADFVLQSGWMARGKAGASALPLASHIGVVALTALAALAPASWEGLAPVLAVTAMHLGIDIAKSGTPPGRLWAFLADQALHIASLAFAAALAPGAWAAGLWAGMGAPAGTSWLPAAMALAAGGILTIRAGTFAIGILMEPWVADSHSDQGLPGGGRAIGYLERGLIFLFVLAGTPEGIGFLIAAKSVLRFGAVGNDRKFSEYVIIGTLASFGWAIALSYATAALLSALPPLGLAAATP